MARAWSPGSYRDGGGRRTGRVGGGGGGALSASRNRPVGHDAHGASRNHYGATWRPARAGGRARCHRVLPASADSRRHAQRPDDGGGGAGGRAVPRAVVGRSPACRAARCLLGVADFSTRRLGGRAGVVVALSDGGSGDGWLGGRAKSNATGATILDRNPGARPRGSSRESRCHPAARRCPGRGVLDARLAARSVLTWRI